MPDDDTRCFERLMTRVGECIDKMRAYRCPADHAQFCVKITNALYLMLLTVYEIRKENAGRLEGVVDSTISACAEQINFACESYLNSSYEDMKNGIAEGMRAIHSFQRCKEILNQILKVSQAESESSTSNEDISQSANSDV